MYFAVKNTCLKIHKNFLTCVTVASAEASDTFTTVTIDTVGTITIIFTGIGNTFIDICQIMRIKKDTIGK